MNRRDKKKAEALKTRLQKLRQQLSGAKKQTVEQEEVDGLEAEIAKAEGELEKLTSA